MCVVSETLMIIKRDFFAHNYNIINKKLIIIIFISRHHAHTIYGISVGVGLYTMAEKGNLYTRNY